MAWHWLPTAWTAPEMPELQRMMAAAHILFAGRGAFLWDGHFV
jgi:hypothetical protein